MHARAISASDSVGFGVERKAARPKKGRCLQDLPRTGSVFFGADRARSWSNGITTRSPCSASSDFCMEYRRALVAFSAEFSPCRTASRGESHPVTTAVSPGARRTSNSVTGEPLTILKQIGGRAVPTSRTLTTPAGKLPFNSAAAFTVTVKSKRPVTGCVTILDGGLQREIAAVVNGMATAPLGNRSPGIDVITAPSAGNTNNLASQTNGFIHQVITRATPIYAQGAISALTHSTPVNVMIQSVRYGGSRGSYGQSSSKSNASLAPAWAKRSLTIGTAILWYGSSSRSLSFSIRAET